MKYLLTAHGLPLFRSGVFVRASKYRHVFGQPAKKELQYENLRVTSNAWDSNLIKTNGKFISVNWNSSGGGAFAVIPVEEVGKAPDQIPLFRGHTAQVLDTDFNNFDDRLIASASDDGKVGIWEIPQDYSLHKYVDEDGTPKDVSPKKFLSGHSKKVGHVLFHPTASNVLASSSLDYTVKVWDIETGEAKLTLKHPDMVTSMSFNYNGDYLATISRDKKLRVWDIRAEKIISEGPAHSGAKNQRVVWLGNSDRIATTGFSRLSDRQIGVWDAFGIEKGDLGGFYNMDQSAGILMPFYDDSNKILYIAGKGDGNIRYFEFKNDELFELSEYQSTEPQRGFAVAPKRAMNVRENEVLRAYKTVGDHFIEPISFHVPRKSDVFQDDIYPDAPSDQPALSASEWFAGKSVDGPVLFNVESLYDGGQPTFTKPNTGANAMKVQEPQEQEIEKNIKRTEADKKTIGKEGDVSEISIKSTENEPVSAHKLADGASNHFKKTSGTQADSVDNLLTKDDSVDKLIQKAATLDADNNAEDPGKDNSAWESEDEEPKTHISQEPLKDTNAEEKAQTNTTASKEQKRKSSDNLSTVVANSTTIVETQTAAKKAVEADSLTEASAGKPSEAVSQRSLNLKQSVEKLSDLVLHLDDVVERLSKENLLKDERLNRLEAKIEQLLKK